MEEIRQLSYKVEKIEFIPDTKFPDIIFIFV